MKSDFLNILEDRGFIHQCSDMDALDQKLSEGAQSAYIGFDATAGSLHIGNLLSIMMLYWFQQTGHKPITLMGGGTTKVGDPSGKDESRKLLDDAAIDNNINSIKQIFKQFLSYGDDETDAVMVNNDDWLKGINYIDFLRDYGRHFSVNRMLSFDSVKLRLEREQNLSFLEFNYMILQAYDFVELRRKYGTILQMGGSDQWGNIINGVELGRRVEGQELFGLTCPLLTTASGAKMGKTAQGAVWLNAENLSPYDYFQYWRNTEDADVGRFLKLFTILPMDEIAKLEKLEGADINEAKKVLAYEATKLCHGKDAADQALATAQKAFEQGAAAEGLPSVEVSADTSFMDIYKTAGLTESNGEFKRLVKDGGAKVHKDDGEVLSIGSITATPSEFGLFAGTYRIARGKKNFANMKIVA